MAATQKDPNRKINVVVVGHVDSGKSTTSSRLIYDLGGIPEREKVKLEELAAQNGKAGFGFAYFMDTGKEERERGITITCQCQNFETENWDYTLTDAPGHSDFINNMMTGTGQADVGILMVPADGNFVSAISKPSVDANGRDEVGGQTRQHAHLINLLGIKQIVVVINKMDCAEGGAYSQARFEEIKAEMSSIIKDAGYLPETVPFIPVSGLHGENLKTPTENMPWYEGWTGRHGYTVKRKKKSYEIVDGTEVSGFTLYDALNDYFQRPDRSPEGTLRMSVSGSRIISGIGLVTMGRVETGTLRIGDVVRLAGKGIEGKVNSIQMHHEAVDAGVAGFNIGAVIKFPSGTKEKDVKKGDFIFRPSDYSTTPEAMPRYVKSFTAQVQVRGHRGELKVGYSPQMSIRTGRAPCRVTAINWVVGKRTGGAKLENPDFVKKNEVAEIVFAPGKFLFAEPFTQCEAYGRAAGMDSRKLVFMCKITDVEYE